MPKKPESEKILTEETDDFSKAIGRKVRELREAKGITRKKLGALTGMAESHLFTLENLGGNVTMRSLTRIAATLDVTLPELLSINPPEVVKEASFAELLEVLERATAAFESLEELLANYQSLADEVKKFTHWRLRLKDILDRKPKPNRRTPGRTRP